MDVIPGSPGELIRRFGARVLSLSYRITLNREVAEEAASDALRKAWENRGSFSGDASFETWLTRIAVHAAIDAARREGVRSPRSAVPLEAAGDIEDPGPDSMPSAREERREDAERVRSAMARLPERHRAALVLREWEGMSYAEMGAALGCPLGTVMSRLCYARKALRMLLEEGS